MASQLEMEFGSMGCVATRAGPRLMVSTGMIVMITGGDRDDLIGRMGVAIAHSISSKAAPFLVEFTSGERRWFALRDVRAVGASHETPTTTRTIALDQAWQAEQMEGTG